MANLDGSSVDWQQYIAGYADPDARIWLARVLDMLMEGGLNSQYGATFIVRNNVQIRIREFAWWQQGMGIRWAADGAIELRADRVTWRDKVKPYLLAGLIHEAKHLEQGKRLALSQLGEVQAWFAEHQVRQELGLARGHIPEAVVWWGVNPTEENFHRARQAIIARQSRRYLFWLLPKYSFWGGYASNLAKLP